MANRGETGRTLKARVQWCAAALALWASPVANAEPLARVEGVEDPALASGLEAALGEFNGETDGAWRARARAREAAVRARRYLTSEGYYGAQIDSRPDPEGGVTMRVRTGPRFVFRSVETMFLQPDGAPDPGGQTREALGLTPGDPLRAEAVIAARARVLSRLHDTGFPEAEEGESEITVDHAVDGARAEFRFQTGPFIRMGEPEQAGGLAELRPGFVARLKPYEIGDPASRSALNTYARRLQALESVSVADVRLSPGAGGETRPVDVFADPAPRHRIETGISWSTSEGAGVEALWTRRNIFHGDETLTLGAQAAELLIGATAGLRVPHWRRFGQTLNLSAGLAAERTDAFDQDVGRLGASVSRVITPRLTAAAGGRLQLANITDALGERTVTTLTLPASAAWDARDDLLDPSRGVFADLKAAPGFSITGSGAQYVRLESGVRGYYSLTDSLVLAGRVRAGTLLGASAEALPASERFFAGGGGSVRGYAYQSLTPFETNLVTGAREPFGGRSLLEAGVEARWRWSPRWGFAAFVDGGAAGRDAAPSPGAMRYGAGAGVRYYPGFGPLRLDIATPIDPRPGDDAIQIYISIGQAF